MEQILTCKKTFMTHNEPINPTAIADGKALVDQCTQTADEAARRLSLPVYFHWSESQQTSESTAADAGSSESSEDGSIAPPARNGSPQSVETVDVNVVNEVDVASIARSQSALELELEAATSPSTPSRLPDPGARRHSKLAARWHRHRHRHRFSVHSNDPAVGCCDDRELCLLCHRCVAAPSGRASGIELATSAKEATAENGDEDEADEEDDSPRAIRLRKVPCDCSERYLHLSCLETSFYDEAVYKHGQRQLIISCGACQVRLRVRRQRGRRTCDGPAWLAFARHLACAGLVAGLLLAFGAWSMLIEASDGGDGEGDAGRATRRVTVVNAGLVAAGCLILLGFACLELWLLHGRFEFAFARVAGAAAAAAAAAAEVNRGFEHSEEAAL